MTSPSAEDFSRGGVGILSGLGVGVVVWILYFIQGAVLNPHLFWDVFVVPGLAAISIGAAHRLSVDDPQALVDRFCGRSDLDAADRSWTLLGVVRGARRRVDGWPRLRRTP